MKKEECEIFKNHCKAGLVHAGENSDGEDEWIGDKSCWDRYDAIINQLDK